jgi:hypothetical protein
MDFSGHAASQGASDLLFSITDISAKSVIAWAPENLRCCNVP